MNMTRLQGWALVLSGVFGLLYFAGDAPLFAILSTLGVVLFILGIPGVRGLQSMGTAGLVGIIAIEVAALIALGINVLGLPASEALVFTSVLTGALGRVIIGWLTAKGSAFPAWAGWAFLLQGVLNLAGYLFLYNMGSIGATLGTIVTVLDVAAAVGYGLKMTQAKA